MVRMAPQDERGARGGEPVIKVSTAGASPIAELLEERARRQQLGREELLELGLEPEPEDAA